MSLNLKMYLIITLTFLFGFLAGFLVFYPKLNILSNKSQEIHEPSNYKYISPLLSCANPASNSLNDLKDLVTSTINSQNDTNYVSLYFRDLYNGPWFGINEDKLFSPASLIKVPMAMAYYRQAETDPGILSKKILNTNQDNNEEQDIKPEKSIIFNQEYSIEQLIEYMIIYSDNNSYQLLADNIDNQILLKTYTDLGININKAIQDPDGNIVSVRDYGSFFRILYNASYLNDQMSNKLLKLLTKTTFKKALVAGVGQEVDIAHKYGERKYLDTGEVQLHDCGIIYSTSRPYLICIMTRGSDFDSLAQTIKLISATIYQYWHQ